MAISFALKFSHALLVACIARQNNSPQSKFEDSVRCPGEPRCLQDTVGYR
jgi:hypothetical protein